MLWIWKFLGYKDENKELIKRYQLEQAKDYFAEMLKTPERPETPPPLPKRLSQKQLQQLKGYQESSVDL
tara:strand:- start:385 stop:591 length:207 start_codon:yes stop_codon:yes gene_type:complete